MGLTEDKAEIKKLLSVTDEQGTHVMTAKEIVERSGKSLNAIYHSRRNGNKLDKLAAFERIKEIANPDVFGETLEEDHF